MMLATLDGGSSDRSPLRVYCCLPQQYSFNQAIYGVFLKNILKIKVPPENCHLHGNQEVFYCQSGKLPYMPYLANFRRTICHFKWLITIVELGVTE